MSWITHQKKYYTERCNWCKGRTTPKTMLSKENGIVRLVMKCYECEIEYETLVYV